MLVRQRKSGSKKIYKGFFIVGLLILLFVLGWYLWRNMVTKELRYYDTGYQNVHNINTVAKAIKVINNIRETRREHIELHVGTKGMDQLKLDRQNAIKNGINIEPRKVKAKVKFGDKKFNAEVELKGDLIDHWSEFRQMSLKVTLKNGYIFGTNKFSIQKPSARQYPWNEIYGGIVRHAGGLYTENRYVAVSFNGERWGVMNFEANVNRNYLENNRLKESLLIKFDDQTEWNYRVLSQKNGTYLSGYKAFDVLFDAKILDKSGGDKHLNLQYSYLIKKLSERDPELLNSEGMCTNLVIAAMWNNYHALVKSNTRYYFDPYYLTLRPIASDAGEFTSYDGNHTQATLWGIDELIDLFLSNKAEVVNGCLNSAIMKVDGGKHSWAGIVKEASGIFWEDSKFTDDPLVNNLTILKDNIKKLSTKQDQEKSTSLTEVVDKRSVLAVSRMLGIAQFSDGTLWILNRLPVPIRIKSFHTSNDLLYPAQSESLIDVQAQTLTNSSSRNYISSPKIFKLKLKDNNQKVRVKFEVLNEIREEAVENIYPVVSSSDNPLSVPTRDAELSSLGIRKKGDECYIKPGSIITFNRPVTLKCNLVIDEGVRILFSRASHLIVNGGVQVNGKDRSEVSFGPLERGGYWGGIYVMGHGRDVTIRNAKLEGMRATEFGILKLTGALTFLDTTVKMINVKISDVVAEDAINLVRTRFKIDSLLIENTVSDAVDSDFSSGEILNSEFRNIGGDGLDLSGSRVVIDKFVGTNIYDKGISVGENSDLSAYNVVVSDVGVGIAVKDGSISKVFDPKFENTKFRGVVTYVKKGMYSSPKAFVYDSSGRYDFSYGRAEGSFLYLDDKLVEGEAIRVKDLYQNGFMKKR